ncbi:hypothetical protein BRD00_01960 [Halobacteriales archaeon QS_8_69_26]|nr:MAG: hypothetical protein BRD00_01960 [Halobacteriales archaeon QS_8_69_26]
MAVSDTDEPAHRDDYVDRITLGRAVAAGVAGGAVFGVVIQFGIGRMAAIGALYTFGIPTVSVGWLAHMMHSVLFGVVFGMATEVEPFHTWMEERLATAALVGIGFGVLLYAVNIAFVWPFWLETVEFAPAADWSIPYTPVRPLVGHLVFGVILGSSFHLLVDY